MLGYKLLKNSGHFGLIKALMKNPIFGVEMSIKRNLPIFPCRYKGLEVDVHHVFHHPKNWRQKYS
jgi:hypothetical protein